MTESKPFTDYLTEVLSKAEEDLSEGDYLTFANALKEAHKKANEPTRNPFIYYPLNWSAVLKDCGGGITSAYVSFDEVGGNNINCPLPTTLHIKGTIDIIYKDVEEPKSIPFNWYSSDTSIIFGKHLLLIEPKTIEFNIYDIKRTDTFDKWKAERKRDKYFNTFCEDMAHKIHSYADSFFWSKVNYDRRMGVISS